MKGLRSRVVFLEASVSEVFERIFQQNWVLNNSWEAAFIHFLKGLIFDYYFWDIRIFLQKRGESVCGPEKDKMLENRIFRLISSRIPFGITRSEIISVIYVLWNFSFLVSDFQPRDFKNFFRVYFFSKDEGKKTITFILYLEKSRFKIQWGPCKLFCFVKRFFSLILKLSFFF